MVQKKTIFQEDEQSVTRMCGQRCYLCKDVTYVRLLPRDWCESKTDIKSGSLEKIVT